MITKGGVRAFSGIISHYGVRSFKGLEEGQANLLPEGAKFYYLFSQPDLDAAKTEQVNGIAQVTTTRASTITIPQTAGGTLEFAAGEAAFDVGQNMQVHPSGFGGATADTRAQISMLDNPSWMIDSPSDNGGVNAAMLGSFTAYSITKGLAFISEGGSDNVFTFRTSSEPSPESGKYRDIWDARYNNAIIALNNGAIVKVRGFINNGGGTFDVLKGSDAEVRAGFEYPNKFTIYATYSDFNTDFSAVKAIRESLLIPDDLTGWPTPTLISDNAGGFKIELDIPDLDHNTGSCVLWKSGDSSLEYDATAGELQSKVAANTAVLALPDLSTAQKAAFTYQDGYVSATVDTGFNPLSLYASGEQGAWYDPSDLSTLFQDTAGTIPVTTDGQLVARMNDKSGNGNSALQISPSFRPVYKEDRGLGWLEFNGTSSYMDMPLKSLFSSADSGSIVASSDLTPNPGNSRVVSFSTNAADTRARLSLYSSIGGDNVLSAAVRRLDSDPFSRVSSSSSVGVKYLSIQSNWSANSARARVGGGAWTEDLSIQTSGITSPTDSTQSTIGGRTEGVAQQEYIQGKVFGVVVINRAITDQEDAMLEVFYSNRLSSLQSNQQQSPVLDAVADILQDGAGGGYADVPKIKAIYGGDV